jgi:hypothetical protein
MSYESVKVQILASSQVDENGCWVWHGPMDSHGYGALRMPGLPAPTQLAHRTAYHVFIKPIPAGMQIDHLCRVRACVNPLHLEPVTPRENTMRSPLAPAARNAQKTECKYGHAFTKDNTRVDPNGRRWCRACESRRLREKRLHRQAIRAAQEAK